MARVTERALNSKEAKGSRERRRRFRYLAKNHFGWSPKLTLRVSAQGRARKEIVLWVFLSVVAAGTITAVLSEDAARRTATGQSQK